MSTRKKKRESIPVASMAGLVRYYEDEKEIIKVSPQVIIIVSIVVIGVIIALSKLLPPP
jgi:preprotein translocase subunit Sec61beta